MTCATFYLNFVGNLLGYTVQQKYVLVHSPIKPSHTTLCLQLIRNFDSHTACYCSRFKLSLLNNSSTEQESFEWAHCTRGILQNLEFRFSVGL